MSFAREPDIKERAAPAPVAPAWWPLVLALPALTGGLWVWWAVSGPLEAILGGLPGVFLLSSSLSSVFSGGDARISQFMTMGAFLGMLLSFPMILTSGLVAAVVLLIFSAASFVAAGYLAVGEVPNPAGVPKPRMGIRLSTKSAVDEVAMFGIVLSTRPLAVGPRAARMARELDEALETFEENGWLDDPESYHRKPPPVEEFGHHRRQRHKGWDLEHLSFESGYEPWPDEPSRERWLSHERNRTAHALVLRHPGEPRPWLVCIHGLRNGSPKGSPDLFQPEYLHRELGLNLLFPFLPLHGPRKAGLFSGERLLSGDTIELVHTGAQAAWDIRRLLAWLRLPGQDAPAVGVLGHSLGGYAAALLCGLDDSIDCVIAANPSVDPSLMFWRDGLSMATRYLKTNGATEKKTDLLLRTVSPLALEPKVNRESRAILASVADRIIPASEPESLWRHWGEPRILWHQGTHFGLLRTTAGKATVKDALRESGVVFGEHRGSEAP